MEGLKHLTEAAYQHSCLLSLDLRHNPCFESKKGSARFKEIMKESFFSNIGDEVKACLVQKVRMKIEWIYPYCLGLIKNNIDNYTDSLITFDVRRDLFVDLINAISEKTNQRWSNVLSAFLGPNHEPIKAVK